MRSREGQRQPKTPYGGWQQREAVKPQGYAGAPSPSPAQDGNASGGGRIDLLEAVLDKGNLRIAYQRVVQNGGAPGVDGVTVEQLREHLWERWESIKTALQTGTYQPSPARRMEIPKPGGGVRQLGIPTVMDRLIQQALLQKLTPIFDSGFSPRSYGFRPGKKAQDAVQQAQAYIQEGYRWVVDMDLEKFFDRVNHDILMARVARQVKDKRILKLIRAYLNAGVMEQGIARTTTEGTPQGGPLSPLLANILLDDLDKELTKRGHRFVRYADDCNIFVKSERAGQRVMESVTNFVEGKLKLKANRDKSAVARPWARKFLGFSFLTNREATIRLAPKTIERFKERIRAITARSRAISMEERIERLNHYIKGWIGYFRLAAAKTHCETLDGWIRRRLRMCLWKQWKKSKTRLRKLLGLRVPAWAAHKMANSGRSPWEMSRNTNNALDTSYWKHQGLESLLVRYLALRQP